MFKSTSLWSNRSSNKKDAFVLEILGILDGFLFRVLFAMRRAVCNKHNDIVNIWSVISRIICGKYLFEFVWMNIGLLQLEFINI